MYEKDFRKKFCVRNAKELLKNAKKTNIAGKLPEDSLDAHSEIETEKEKRGDKLTNFFLIYSVSKSVLIRYAVSVGF